MKPQIRPIMQFCTHKADAILRRSAMPPGRESDTLFAGDIRASASLNTDPFPERSVPARETA
ncbi:hypothetical protein N9M10_01980 [Hellea sp.]|nr:hypothetical protein [Hellea sp.]